MRDRRKRFSDNARGRARWKIENETFNTLKNQGYHLNIIMGMEIKPVSGFCMLMMLAFLWIRLSNCLSVISKSMGKIRQ